MSEQAANTHLCQQQSTIIHQGLLVLWLLQQEGVESMSVAGSVHTVPQVKVSEQAVYVEAFLPDRKLSNRAWS